MAAEPVQSFCPDGKLKSTYIHGGDVARFGSHVMDKMFSLVVERTQPEREERERS